MDVFATHDKMEETKINYVLHHLGIAIHMFTMIQNVKSLISNSKSTRKLLKLSKTIYQSFTIEKLLYTVLNFAL